MNNNKAVHHLHQSNRSHSYGLPDRLEALSLSELMRLAAQFHMGLMNMKTSGADMNAVVKLIKERASSELDEGDGMKCETVRVERRLDGAILIFFGM